MIDIVVPRVYWDEALSFALMKSPDSDLGLSLPMGSARCAGDLLLLARRSPAPEPAQVEPEGSSLTILLTSSTGRGASLRLPAGPAVARGWNAFITLGCGRDEGVIEAQAYSPDGIFERVRNLRLPGPGMHSLALSGRTTQTLGFADGFPRERWSRSIGAIGEGAWLRLTELTFGVVGCGRLGSMIASSLARLGARRLVLIDPDTVERHNLGEGEGLGEVDIGKPKAQALLASLGKSYPWVRGQAVDLSVSRWDALAALKPSDVIFSSAAGEAGRLASGLLASRYQKVLIDVGTAVFADGEGGRITGAEIRLVLPGDGCLGCLGGVTDQEAAWEQLNSPDAEDASLHDHNWWRQRAGSLNSLNHIATGLAIGQLERVVTGEQRRSCWLRLVWNAESSPRLTASSPIYRSSQCVCNQTGRGDGE